MDDGRNIRIANNNKNPRDEEKNQFGRAQASLFS